jgi:hypothetical protein
MAGTHGRVVEVWGSPFGTADAATAGIVRQLQAALQENYGHAGPLFVRWLLAHEREWGQFRTRFRELRSTLMEHAGDKPLAMRLCDPLAAICLAEELAHEALDLPAGKMPNLCIELLGQIKETDRPAEALRYVHGWASSRQHQLFNGRGQGGSQSQSAAHELVGRWDRPNGQWIGFFPNWLEHALQQGGYDLDDIVASWRDHEGGSVRTRIRKSVGSDPNARVFAIRLAAIEQVDPPGPDTGEELSQTALDEDSDPEGTNEEADTAGEGDE